MTNVQLNKLILEVEILVGSDTTGDVRSAVIAALAADPAITACEIAGEIFTAVYTVAA